MPKKNTTNLAAELMERENRILGHRIAELEAERDLLRRTLESQQVVIEELTRTQGGAPVPAGTLFDLRQLMDQGQRLLASLARSASR